MQYSETFFYLYKHRARIILCKDREMNMEMDAATIENRTETELI